MSRAEYQDEAIGACQNALRLKANYGSPYYNLGIIYQTSERYPEALAAFKQATKLKPAYADAYFGLAASYFYLGKYRESIKALSNLSFGNFSQGAWNQVPFSPFLCDYRHDLSTSAPLVADLTLWQ